MVLRPRCVGQFRLSFFRRRAGPRRSGEVRSEPQATNCGDTNAMRLLQEGAIHTRTDNLVPEELFFKSPTREHGPLSGAFFNDLEWK